MPTASIIISSYNYAQYLPVAIESALAQQIDQTEVIVVDDGSTDDSARIIRSFGDRVCPILKSNAGQASAINAGFAASSGECVIFLDSDDALEPHAAARAAGMLRQGVSKVHWPLREIDPAGRSCEKVVPASELASGDLRNVVLTHGPRSDNYIWPPTSGNAWSRAFLEQVLPMPEAPYRTCPDLYLCALAPLYGEVAASRQPLGMWRSHGANNTWNEPFAGRVRRYIQLWEQCCSDLERHARRLGLTPDTGRWRDESWWHRLGVACDTLRQVLPEGSTFVLVDDDQWACENLDGRRALPLVSRGGQAWGAPPDDAAAVAELERRLRDGARYVVVPWHAHWWLEHYRALAARLRQGRIVWDDELLTVFELGDHKHA